MSMNPFLNETTEGLRGRHAALQGVLNRVLDELAVVNAELSRRQVSIAPSGRQRAWTYTVRAGDTLAAIAYRFFGPSLSFQALGEYNGLSDPYWLEVGDLIQIPAIRPRRFRFPLDRIETSYYKFGALYSPGTRWAGKPHPGVDFDQGEGAPVYAIGEGRVTVNRVEESGYGHYLIVEHDLISGSRRWSLYAHLQYDDAAGFVTPRVGEWIRGLDVQIGRQGYTGAGAGGVSHVHTEVKKTSDLGLMPELTMDNLRDWYEDPYAFIGDARNLFAPV